MKTGSDAAEEVQKGTGPADQLGQENDELTKGSEGSENKSKEGKENEGGEKDKQDETFTIKAITKLDDGTFEFAVNDETVYRGKTVDEVLEKIREGTNVKDSLIRKAKISEKLSRPKASSRRDERDDEDHPDIKAPDEKEIAGRVVKEALERAGITMEQARNVDKDKYWEDYKDKNPEMSDLAINRLRMKIDSVLDKADAAIAAEVETKSLVYQNEQTSLKAQRFIEDMLDEAKIPVEQVGEGKAFDWYAILKKCEEDGVLDGQKAIAEATRVIRQIERSSNKSTVQQKLAQDAEKAKRDREKVAGPGSAERDRGTKITPAKDYRSATAEFLKTHKFSSTE